jgi:hypothetical protein
VRYSKYEAIPHFLESLGSDMVEVTLDDLAGAVGGLPQSAYTYQAWWSNNEASSAGRQCHRWMEAGWIAHPKLDEGKVLFRRRGASALSAAGTPKNRGQSERTGLTQGQLLGTSDERIRVEIVLDLEDIPLWLEFRRRGGNSSRLFSSALRAAVEPPRQETAFSGDDSVEVEKHNTVTLQDLLKSLDSQ